MTFSARNQHQVFFLIRAQWLISVSCPGSKSKPMRTCENKKQSPQNKHAYPSNFSQNIMISLIFIRRHFSLLVFTVCIVRLGDLLEERRRGREGGIVFVHILVSAWKIEQRAGIPGSRLHGLKIWQKWNEQNCFFLAWLWNQCAEDEKQRN